MKIKSWKEFEIEKKNIIDTRLKCPCGHVIIFSVLNDYKICSWCGRKVKNKTKARFVYLLRKTMEDKNENIGERVQHREEN